MARRSPGRRGVEELTINYRSAIRSLALLATLLAHCGGEPGYRPGSVTSLIASFDRIVVESSPREPVQLRLITVGGTERASIVTHAPARVRVPDLPIGSGATFRFAVGLADSELTRLSDGVRFAVLVDDGDDAPQQVWSLDYPVVPVLEERAWQEASVDLSDWAGRRVDLILTTEAGRNAFGDWAAWSHPLIRGSTEPADPAAFPVRRNVIDRDLLPGEPVPDCVVQTVIDVPGDASVDLAAQVLRDQDGPAGALGPLRLSLAADGTDLLTRRLSTIDSIITVADTVPLAGLDGRQIDLEFSLCDEGQGNSLTWARRLWLSHEERVPRLAGSSGPNVLVVLLVDTLRADRLGLYGYPRDTSPTLDRMARDSLVFDQAIAPSSWTLPSVASILTGLSPLEHGVIEGVPLPPAYPTLGELFQEQGFTTFGFSANPIVGRLEAMHRGFETFAQVPWGRADQVNRVFLDWLEEREGLRWFAYLHYIDPHSPFDAPAPVGDRFLDGCRTEFGRADRLQSLSAALNFGLGEEAWQPSDIACLANYYDGEIRFFDRELEGLLDALRRRRLLENTVIVVTSDHGEEFMEHGGLLHGYQLFEESIHVPLILRAPGLVEPGRVAGTVETRALFDTLLDLVGRTPPEGGLGSLLGSVPRADEPVFSHTTEAFIKGRGYTVLASVRDDRWKYILRPEDGHEQLYDLQNDPGETTNRAAERPDVRGHYQRLLSEWLSGARAEGLQERGLDLDTLEKLRALGYIR